MLDYNARWFDPLIGRFVSPDTIIPQPANPQDFNRYSYVRNNPANYTDPSGHCGGDINTGETYCSPGNTLTVDGNPSGAPIGLAYGPPTPPHIREAARQAQIRETEYKIALAINTTFLLINGIGGPLAGAYGTPPMGNLQSRTGGYGGKYYPPGQVGMATALDYTVPGSLDIPHGFTYVEEFAGFLSSLQSGLHEAGFSDVIPVFQGSSVTGYKYTTGAPFDVGRISDFDIGLASPTLLARAEELGIGLRSQGTRTGPLSPGDLEQLGLTSVAAELSHIAGRPVTPISLE